MPRRQPRCGPHLRYVFARIERHSQLESTPSELMRSIADNYPEEIACAHRIGYLIRLGLGSGITSDEVAFIAIHVARLLGDLNEGVTQDASAG